MVRKCSNCVSEFSDDIDYCPLCGQQYRQVQQPQSATAPAKVEEHVGPGTVAKAIGAFVLLVIVFAFIYWMV